MNASGPAALLPRPGFRPAFHISKEHPMNESITDLAQRLSRIRREKAAETVQPAPVQPAVEEPPAPPAPSAGDGLVPHGDPIDIGWVGGSLDARLHLYVRPGMDPLEREQLLADLRDALAPVVPVRPARRGEFR